MVRGSDSESGDKEFSKSKYDGTVSRWPPGRIKLKSTLFTRGLWDVVEKGPTTIQASPASVTPGTKDDGTTAQEWYYAERDNTVRGPCSAEKLTKVFNYISQNELLTGESVYVFHQTNKAGI